MTPSIFLDWFNYAVSRVGNGYFGYAERVYCYELYHYLRVAMFHYEQSNGAIENIFLHSELVKTVLSDEKANTFDIYPLKNRRMPDFLFHTPGNFDNQIAAVEVKTTASLSYDDLMDDLNKLSELKQNYQYRLVVFHCVNNQLSRITGLLSKALGNKLELEREILVACKPAFNVQMVSRKLGELIDEIT